VLIRITSLGGNDVPENAMNENAPCDAATAGRPKKALTFRFQVAAAVVVLALVGVITFAVQHRVAPAESGGTQPNAQVLPSATNAGENPTDLPPTAPPGAMDAISIVADLAQTNGVVPNQVWYENDINTVVAYVPPGPAPELAAFTDQVNAFAAGAKGFSVMVVPVDRSTVESLALQKKIEADTAYLTAHGVTIASDGISPNGATVMVSILNGDLPAARTLFTDRFGAGIVVEQVTALATY
jgi:hypothetical protein